MSHYTIHLAFNTRGAEYHIYGTMDGNQDYAFGKSYGLNPANFHKIDIAKLEQENPGRYGDYGVTGLEQFAKDGELYSALADAAVTTGKRVFVINCHAGKLRTRIMAARLFMELTNCEANVAVDRVTAPDGKKKQKNPGKDEVIAKGIPMKNSEQVDCIKAALGIKPSVGRSRNRK